MTALDTQAETENPLLEGLRLMRTPEPCAIVIFGASGDLAKRKLFPALYALAFRNLLPTSFAIVGSARTPMSDDDFRTIVEESIREYARDEFRSEVWDGLAGGVRYVTLDFSDDARQDKLAACLGELDEGRGTRGNRLFYFSVPPDAIATLVTELGERRTSEGWTRLIIEKPFGHYLASAL